MPHQVRWIPTPRTLVEVTTRTFQSRYLLKPTPEVRELVLGVIGRAQRIYGMKICLLTFMSNHYHMLLVPRDPRHLARFMGFVNGQIANEINRLGHWGAKVWARRFDPIVVSDEPAAQRARFRYLLSHGVKEGLVERPRRWVGVHGVDAWLRDEPLVGYWFDRTRETRAKRLGRRFERLAFATEETVHLSPLPCWVSEELDRDAIRREIEEMVEEIIRLGRLDRVFEGRPEVRDVEALLSLPWDYRPRQTKRSPKPRFHFRSREAKKLLRSSLGAFLEAYRRASEALRAGRKGVPFPERCFPPAGPFVSEIHSGAEI